MIKDGVEVSFVKSFSNHSDTITNIIHSIYSDNSMDSFTGDGHSIIKQVHEKDLSDALKLLKDYSDSHKKNVNLRMKTYHILLIIVHYLLLLTVCLYFVHY